MLSKSNFLARHPLFVYASIFVAGVVSAHCLHGEGLLFAACAFVLTLSLSFCIRFRTLALYAAFFLGILVYSFRFTPTPTSDYPSKSLLALKEQRPNYSIYTIKGHYSSKKWLGIKSDNQVIFYHSKDASSPAQLVATNPLKPVVKSIKNQGFRDYLLHKNVFYSYQLKAENHLVIKQKRKLDWAQSCRAEIRSYLKNQNLNNESQAILSAILIGDKNGLNKELKANFRDSGTIHLLVVSGFHVGLILSIFMMIAYPLRHLPKGDIWQYSFALICMWLFVAVEGFGIASSRAASMLSIFVLSVLLRRKYSILNILGFTCLLNCLIEPNDVFTASFHLSYGAVLGIALIYPFWNSAFKTHQPILKYISGLVGISVSVQIIITPIMAYHFGQVSSYSILANLYAIPLTIIIVWTTICATIATPFYFLSESLFSIVDELCKLFIQLNSWVSNLPNSILYCQLHLSDLILYYLATTLFLVILNTSNRQLLKFGVPAILLITGLSGFGIF